MSFDAVEKYNTYKRLLIPKETGMFATVAVLSKWTPKGRHQRACAKGQPADQLCIVSKICFRLFTCRVIFSLRQAF